MCWLCRAVDHVFDSLDPYLDSGNSFKRYSYKKKLHGGTINTSKPKKKFFGNSKPSKQPHTGKYVQNENKLITLRKPANANTNENVHVTIKKEHNIYDVYHRNNLKRARSVQTYINRPQIMHRKNLGIERSAVRGMAGSAKDLRSTSLQRSLAQKSKQRSRSEGTDIRRSSTVPNRKNIQSRRVKRLPKRVHSYSPTRNITRHHSHDEIVHMRTHRNLGLSKPPSVKSLRERAQKHQSVEGDRPLKHRNDPRHSSRNRTFKYIDESLNSRKTGLKQKDDTNLKGSSSKSIKKQIPSSEEIAHRESRLDVRGAVAFSHSYSESNEEESEEEEEEYDKEFVEENEEISSPWQNKIESLRIRRGLRKEYFSVMDELFAMSGDGINSKEYI